MSFAESKYSLRPAIRSRRKPVTALTAEPVCADMLVAAPAWRDDLRLFAITWAAGFVFFLAFLA